MPDTKFNTPAAEKPPIFRTWNHFYAFVLALHAVIILLFYVFKMAYA
ncbi:MAG TPA: hypothetical protein PKD70_10855 [Saprospiraceae bacterium]|nr:hypothetical protein [Saprospiraceae bacterium]HMP14369.1 hypothetical protein [Saprospiraceae bacterium]